MGLKSHFWLPPPTHIQTHTYIIVLATYVFSYQLLLRKRDSKTKKIIKRYLYENAKS